jgi:two-component system nitrate/nitrite response regulator NarL
MSSDPAPIKQVKHRVLVIDEHPLSRRGIADLLAIEDALVLVGEAADSANGIELAKETQPDLLLLDPNLKDMNSLATLQKLREVVADARIIMLTVSENEETMLAALRAGADGCLLMDSEPEDILNELRLATQGRLLISENLTQRLAQALRAEATPNNALEAGLSPHEEDIVSLIAQGLSNELIAQELDVKIETIKTDINQLLKKLKLHTRVEAAAWAFNSKR